MTAHFNIQPTSDGAFVFVLKAADGKVIMRSERYEDFEAAKAAMIAAREMARNGVTGTKPPRSQAEREALSKALRLIREQGRAIALGKIHSLDHGDLLYDEWGLRK